MLSSLQPLVRFAPTVLGTVANFFVPGSGDAVKKIAEQGKKWYDDKRAAAEKAEIIRALQITEEKLNTFDRMFILLGRDCLQLLERVDALERQGQDATDEILRAMLDAPELQARFDEIGNSLAKLDGRVSGLEADVRRLDEQYASLGAFAAEAKQKQLSDTELADFREFRRAKQFQSAGRFAESEPILLKLANSQPQSAAVAVALAVAQHDRPQAFDTGLKKAIRLRPEDANLRALASAATVAVTGRNTPAARPAPPVARVPKVGDTLDGWVLEARLGGGGWGIVFRAVKKGQTKALKVMRPDLTDHAEFVEAFHEEALKLNRLRHANVVAVERIGVCWEFQCPYFVMPLLDGLTLEAHLDRHGVPSADTAMGWLTGLLDGLEHAHVAGLIHRDVKPLNVIVQPDGRAVLIDFGIAGLDGVAGYTQALGKSSFFAPPELHGLGQADARADLFMLAATVFYAIRYDHPQKDRAWSKFKAERVPEVFRAALAKALSADETDRPATAAEMRGLLIPASRVSHDAGSEPDPLQGRLAKTEPPVRKAGDRHEIALPGGVKMAFAWCPAGTFQMGSPSSEKERGDDEAQHEVRLTKGFWMGIHPVTQAQYQAVMGTNPSHFKGDELPVEQVNWDDTQEFRVRLKGKTGVEVRLPTEAEWEYAARGGTGTPFYWGSELNGTQANCNGNDPYGTTTNSRTSKRRRRWALTRGSTRNRGA